MKLNQIAAAVALTMLAGVAQATAFTVSPNPMVVGSVYNQTVFHTPGIAFEDTFSFTINSLQYDHLDMAWVGFKVDVMATGVGYITKIDNFAVSLWHDLATDVLLSTDPIGGARLYDGNYYLKVTGNSAGIMGSNYLMTIATSVPEPQTLALLGLGLLGLGISRRR